jgi:hypothetical protein
MGAKLMLGEVRQRTAAFYACLRTLKHRHGIGKDGLKSQIARDPADYSVSEESALYSFLQLFITRSISCARSVTRLASGLGEANSLSICCN